MGISAERFNASLSSQVPGGVTHRAVWAAYADIAKMLSNVLS